MKNGRVINFGYFLRHLREQKNLSRSEFIAKAQIKLSERRLWQIEMTMPAPRIQPAKFEAIAGALGYEREQLEKAWQSTPVPIPPDENRKRKNDLHPLSQWLNAEAARLEIDLPPMIELLMHLLAALDEPARDRFYHSPAASSDPSRRSLRIPQPVRDSRLRPAAKTIGHKPKNPDPEKRRGL